MNENIIEIDHIKKKYRLGTIGGGTLRGDIQSWWALKRGKEDPNSIVTEGGSKVVKGEFWALDGVSFNVKKGERIGIIGTNGAGKSTLLKIISKITAPTDGEVRLNGKVTSMLEIGTGFHGELSGRENIYFNGAILGMKKNEIDAVIEDIIDFSECRDFIDTPVKRYSSGMYVKLAFSVAAHLNSDIMIMDEVLAVGDVNFQRKCLDKMAEVSRGQGKTILYVSHNMATIRRLCERCIVLEKGKVIFDGDVEKSIQKYLKIDGALKVNNVVDDSMRDFVVDSDMTLRSKLLAVDILNDSGAMIEQGDTVQIKIAFQNFENVDEVFVRIVFFKLDGTPIATAMSDAIEGCNKGTIKEIAFSIDISGFVAGEYVTKIILFRPTYMGTHEKYDCVTNAFGFEIEATKGQYYNYSWPSGWGSFLIPIHRIG